MTTTMETIDTPSQSTGEAGGEVNKETIEQADLDTECVRQPLLFVLLQVMKDTWIVAQPQIVEWQAQIWTLLLSFVPEFVTRIIGNIMDIVGGLKQDGLYFVLPKTKIDKAKEQINNIRNIGNININEYLVNQCKLLVTAIVRLVKDLFRDSIALVFTLGNVVSNSSMFTALKDKVLPVWDELYDKYYPMVNDVMIGVCNVWTQSWQYCKDCYENKDSIGENVQLNVARYLDQSHAGLAERGLKICQPIFEKIGNVSPTLYEAAMVLYKQMMNLFVEGKNRFTLIVKSHCC